jgi:hypothetical protein
MPAHSARAADRTIFAPARSASASTTAISSELEHSGRVLRRVRRSRRSGSLTSSVRDAAVGATTVNASNASPADDPPGRVSGVSSDDGRDLKACSSRNPAVGVRADHHRRHCVCGIGRTVRPWAINSLACNGARALLP